MAEILRDPPVKTFNFWHFKEDAKVLAFDAEGSKGLPRLIKVIKAEKTDALFPLGLVDMGYSDEDEDIVYGKTIGHVTFETEEAREAAYQSLISIKPSEGKAFEAACETLGEQLENPFDKYNMDEDIREANIYGLIADFDIKFEDAPEGEVDHVQALADGVIYRGGPFAPDARTPQMIAAHEAEGYGISMPPISLEEMVTEIVKPGRINHQSIEWNVKLHYADMETFSDEVRKEMDLDPRFDDRWAAYLKNDGEGNVFNWIVEDMREPYLSAPNTYNEVTVWASGPEHKDHLSVDFKFNGRSGGYLAIDKVYGSKLPDLSHRDFADNMLSLLQACPSEDAIRDLYFMVKTLDHEITPQNLAKDFNYRAAFQRSQKEEEWNLEYGEDEDYFYVTDCGEYVVQPYTKDFVRVGNVLGSMDVRAISFDQARDLNEEMQEEMASSNGNEGGRWVHRDLLSRNMPPVLKVELEGNIANTYDIDFAPALRACTEESRLALIKAIACGDFDKNPSYLQTFIDRVQTMDPSVAHAAQSGDKLSVNMVGNRAFWEFIEQEYPSAYDEIAHMDLFKRAPSV